MNVIQSYSLDSPQKSRLMTTTITSSKVSLSPTELGLSGLFDPVKIQRAASKMASMISMIIALIWPELPRLSMQGSIPGSKQFLMFLLYLSSDGSLQEHSVP